ncbi:MAG: FAD:protein FMN transferase [Prevotellaceae bacterium]|jgi:thiamine biosynthesis lipoprotein|nr:FAD:protein FMN transferase [Prevotellaceae bacterium]
MHFITRFCSIVCLLFLCSCNYHAEYRTIDGFVFGTSYHIVYQEQSGVDGLIFGHDEVRQLVVNTFIEIDNSLSVYNPQSIISKVNRNEPVVLDSLFVNVFERGKEIYRLTNGTFDMAAAPYFDLWGFGFNNREQVTQAKLDSIALFAGMDKIWLSEGRIEKADPRVSLNGNAIAKGYASDVVASRFSKAGLVNFLIEIGGEIHCQGVNPNGKKWRVLIDRPVYGNYIPGKEMQAILLLSNRGLATSGNYRNFYEEDGQKYGHTVDPATGKPVIHSLLSATVLAHDCMTADALATAFMVMGLDKTRLFLQDHPQIDAYLVYSDELGTFQSYATKNITIKNNS